VREHRLFLLDILLQAGRRIMPVELSLLHSCTIWWWIIPFFFVRTIHYSLLFNFTLSIRH